MKPIATIKIAKRFENLTDAVADTKMDLSYNEPHARQKMREMTNDTRLKIVEVFADECNEVWYILKVVSENLNILHKFDPFLSCLSDAPFKVFVPTKNGEEVALNEADSLSQLGWARKENAFRRMIAKAGMIAG